MDELNLAESTSQHQYASFSRSLTFIVCSRTTHHSIKFRGAHATTRRRALALLGVLQYFELFRSSDVASVARTLVELFGLHDTVLRHPFLGEHAAPPPRAFPSRQPVVCAAMSWGEDRQVLRRSFACMAPSQHVRYPRSIQRLTTAMAHRLGDAESSGLLPQDTRCSTQPFLIRFYAHDTSLLQYRNNGQAISHWTWRIC